MFYYGTTKLVRFKEGVDGLKTGYTATAGYCLTATAKKNNMRLITVVMKEETANVRNSETSEMLDYGFAQYELEVMLDRNSILGKSEVDKGKKRYVEIVPKEDIAFLNKKLDIKTNATYKIKMKTVKAPVKIGDIVGTIEIYDNNEIIKEVPLTVKENIAKANLIELYFRNLKDIVTGNIEV